LAVSRHGMDRAGLARPLRPRRRRVRDARGNADARRLLSRVGVGAHERFRERHRRLTAPRLLRHAGRLAAVHCDARGGRMEMGMRRLDGPTLLQLAGVVAAIVLAGVVNVLCARHSTRWDWTKAGRWTLSPSTMETLRDLQQPVEVWVVAGPGDPLEVSLRQLLASYQGQSSRIEVHWVDPDRDTVALLDLQHRFGLEAGRAENGRI